MKAEFDKCNSKFTDEIASRCTEFVKNESGEADEGRLDILIEFAQFYPHAITRNKNASPGLDSIWKDKKSMKEDAAKEAELE